MRTRLFQWAGEQKLDIGQLATMTGYTPRHLYRIRKLEDSAMDVPDAFKAALVDRMGDWARSLFLPSVSQERDARTQTRASIAAVAASPAPAKRTAPVKPNDTKGRGGARTVRPSGLGEDAA